MTEEMARKYARWLDADEADRPVADDEADEACAAVFSTAVPPRPVSQAFTAATMARVGEARVADARRARLNRRAMAAAALLLGPVALYFGGGLLVSAASTLLVGGLSVVVDAGVRVATVGEWNIWALVGNMGRASAAVLADSTFTIAMLAMHGIAVAALVALQRLLGPET